MRVDMLSFMVGFELASGMAAHFKDHPDLAERFANDFGELLDRLDEEALKRQRRSKRKGARA